MVLVSYKLDSHVSILQTKLSHRERYEARRIGLEAMPLDQHIEGGHGECQAGLKVLPAPVHDFLEVADHRQHREHRLHQHAVLPRTALTQFEVGGVTLRRMETGVTQDNHAPVDLANEPLKGVIRDIGRVARPPHDQPPLVQQQTEFAPDNPAVVRHTCAADLLRAAAFAPGVDELDAVGVNDAEHRRDSPESLRPVLMRLQEAKEPGALGEAGEQGARVARQPAIERAVADAFQRMEKPQGDDLAGPEVGLGMLRDGAQLLIDLVEEGGNKIEGGHGVLRSWQGGTFSSRLEEVYDQDNEASKYYCIYWFVRD